MAQPLPRAAWFLVAAVGFFVLANLVPWASVSDSGPFSSSTLQVHAWGIRYSVGPSESETSWFFDSGNMAQRIEDDWADGSRSTQRATMMWSYVVMLAVALLWAVAVYQAREGKLTSSLRGWSIFGTAAFVVAGLLFVYTVMEPMDISGELKFGPFWAGLAAVAGLVGTVSIPVRGSANDPAQAGTAQPYVRIRWASIAILTGSFVASGYAALLLGFGFLGGIIGGFLGAGLGFFVLRRRWAKANQKPEARAPIEPGP